MYSITVPSWQSLKTSQLTTSRVLSKFRQTNISDVSDVSDVSADVSDVIYDSSPRK